MPEPREYPEGAVVRIEDFDPIELAYAEANHEDCTDPPPSHSLVEHSPWSGGDLDGVEPWPAFVERLRRHGLALVQIGPAPDPELARAIFDIDNFADEED